MEEVLLDSKLRLIEQRSEEALVNGYVEGDVIYSSAMDVPILIRELRRLRDALQVLEKAAHEVEPQLTWLAALEAAGVDNWQGYEIAQDLVTEWEAEENARE